MSVIDYFFSSRALVPLAECNYELPSEGHLTPISTWHLIAYSN